MDNISYRTFELVGGIGDLLESFDDYPQGDLGLIEKFNTVTVQTSQTANTLGLMLSELKPQGVYLDPDYEIVQTLAGLSKAIAGYMLLGEGFLDIKTNLAEVWGCILAFMEFEDITLETVLNYENNK